MSFLFVHLCLQRIFARDGSYEQFETESLPSARWWAHHSSISPDGWELVLDRVVKASWDTPTELFFDQRVVVLPRRRKAFYVHSGLPDDLGVQYQSYREEDVVAENEHLLVLPGLGHTVRGGSEEWDGGMLVSTSASSNAQHNIL